MLVCAFVRILVLLYIFQFFDCALGVAFLFEFRLGMGRMAVYQYIFCGAQTVELTASNATQINVRLYSWIRCCQVVI